MNCSLGLTNDDDPEEEREKKAYSRIRFFISNSECAPPCAQIHFKLFISEHNNNNNSTSVCLLVLCSSRSPRYTVIKDRLTFKSVIGIFVGKNDLL